MPRVGFSRPRDHLEEGGLAGTIGAEQGQRLPLVNLERYPKQHLQLPVGEIDFRDCERVGALSLIAHLKGGFQVAFGMCQHLHEDT